MIREHLRRLGRDRSERKEEEKKEEEKEEGRRPWILSTSVFDLLKSKINKSCR